MGVKESSRKIRVANIIEEGKLGGPQVRIANVARALKPYVETTVVLPLENSDRFRAKLEEYNIPYKTFNLSRITKEVRVALRYLFFSWYEVLQLARYFRKENFDLIHVSGGSWQYKGVVAGKLAGRKVVWHLNDTYMPWFIRKIFSLFSWLPDAYIFASERSCEYYRPLISLDKPSFIIPAPVETKYFSPDISIAMDGKLVNEWEGKIVIGTIANINPIKGIDVFINVAAFLNKEFCDLQFVVVGALKNRQYNFFSKLKSLAAERGVANLLFVGPMDDVRSIIYRMNIYLCTSYAESSPISVWEAMSMGKAIVSADVGDVSKYVISGISGEIVPVGDVESFAKKVAMLIRNPACAVSYGKEARRIAVERLDICYCSDRHFSAYNYIIAE